jgi:hypothetical protein
VSLGLGIQPAVQSNATQLCGAQVQRLVYCVSVAHAEFHKQTQTNYQKLSVIESFDMMSDLIYNARFYTAAQSVYLFAEQH